MDEHLERQASGGGGLLRLDPGDVREGILSRQHDHLRPQIPGESDSRGAGDGHLGRTMDGKIRRDGADQAADADVLHDGGVDAGRDHAAHIILRLGQLVGEDQGVEGDIAPNAALMEERHQLGQLGHGEVAGPHAGIEPLQPEIDRIGAVLHRGAHARPVPGRGEHLRANRGVVPAGRAFDGAGWGGRHGSNLHGARRRANLKRRRLRFGLLAWRAQPAGRQLAGTRVDRRRRERARGLQTNRVSREDGVHGGASRAQATCDARGGRYPRPPTGRAARKAGSRRCR